MEPNNNKAIGRPGSTPYSFQLMAKPRGALCNLDCQYCYYLAKQDLYPKSSLRMSDEVLETYIRSYIQSQHTPEVIFAWQGGEPTLMGLNFFQRAVELQEKYRQPGVSILNTLQTNGLLIDDEWATFFNRHRFLLGVSLDGPAHLHDVYRVDKAGSPTQERVVSAIVNLQKHAVEFNILCCVHAANEDHPLEVYQYFRDIIKAQFIQFIPVVERGLMDISSGGKLVSARSVSALGYGNFLTKIFDEWIRHDVGRIFVQIFDVTLSAWSGFSPGLCIFNETCGQALALEHNGDLYSCDHFVEPGYWLGNISNQDIGALARSMTQVHFGDLKQSTLPLACLDCNVRFVCNGGCPKDRILSTSSGEPGLNYLCDGYLHFFTHTAEPMRTMSDLLKTRRPPAEIMDMLVSEEGRVGEPAEKRRRRRRKV